MKCRALLTTRRATVPAAAGAWLCFCRDYNLLGGCVTLPRLMRLFRDVAHPRATVLERATRRRFDDVVSRMTRDAPASAAPTPPPDAAGGNAPPIASTAAGRASVFAFGGRGAARAAIASGAPNGGDDHDPGTPPGVTRSGPGSKNPMERRASLNLLFEEMGVGESDDCKLSLGQLHEVCEGIDRTQLEQKK